MARDLHSRDVSSKTNDRETWGEGTHERPHALPEHIHRDARHQAPRLNARDDDEGAADPSGEDEAVGEERRAVGDEALDEPGEREDVRGVSAVRVDHVCDARRVGHRDAEVGHPVGREGGREVSEIGCASDWNENGWTAVGG